MKNSGNEEKNSASQTAEMEINSTLNATPTWERSHNRNYIGMNGREVYYRNRKAHGCSKEREGWTCSYCGRFELDCACPSSPIREGTQRNNVNGPPTHPKSTTIPPAQGKTQTYSIKDF